jgi:plastocyanin domain-containing protein
MSIDKILVLILGIGLSGFTYWFFFGKKEDELEVDGETEIIVSGGYKPSVLKVKKGQKLTLSLLRTEDNSCLEEFIIPELKIKKYLPVGKKVRIDIDTSKVGEYRFNCGMNMFHGKVSVI